MGLISDAYQEDKLAKLNINIRTKYIVNNTILERNTNSTKNDNIKNGIICKKEYYKDNKLLHEEKMFDSRIEYTYISKDNEDKNYTCPNCGNESKIKNFIDGCPYCGTNFNIDYTDKELGSKYHYDMVIRTNKYKVITAIMDIIISLLLSYLFIKITSRTFNVYDMSKIFIYGLILSTVLYYFFYIIDAYIVIYPIKCYKNKQNNRQKEFWKRTNIDKKTFYNNLNYGLRKKYYKESNIIDYDILDYLEFNEHTKIDDYYVEVILSVRKIIYKNNEIKSLITKEKVTLKKNKNYKKNIKIGPNIINCPNCGASINSTKEKCQYCNTEINNISEWTIADTQ